METIATQRRGWFRRLLAFVGPAYLISVGYMDPGNWATDIEGGSRFGYSLLWVLLLSNLMALILQTLAARLGVVTGYDLAQGCRREYSRTISGILWILSEIAIAATDLAEVLGTVLGLNLIFGLPMLWGCAVTATDTFLLLLIQRLGVRRMEAFILMLVGTISACFAIQLFIGKPDWGAAIAGLRPTMPPGALFVAIGIIGATVMPHNLFLHSSLVQSRSVNKTFTGISEACRYNLIDVLVALNGAFLVNAAILIMGAVDFHSRGIVVTEIQQAYHLLQPILGSHVAPIAFGIALLASGQSSTLTGTISGQVVMEGFVDLHMRPWVRRLLTRSLALIPAVIVIALAGNEGTYKLLLFSQVILSLQLPFAVIPLVHFTSQREKMGVFANPSWVRILAWLVAGLVVFLNVKLLVDSLGDPLAGQAIWLRIGAWGVIGALAGLLIYLTVAPLIGRRKTWQSGDILPGSSVAQQMHKPVIRTMGVALENSPGDAETLSMAVSLAKLHRARLTLIHVVESPGTLVYEANSESLHARQDMEYVEGVAREIEDPDLAVDVVVRGGHSPADTIIALTRELGLDMLIMGSHGHKGWQDLVFGETVRGVRHALTIPVVVVRTGAKDQKPT